MIDDSYPYCAKCLVPMEKQAYKHPYISTNGNIIHHALVDVYICPCCGREEEQLPNEDDEYSAGAGLLSDD
jgi:hypothetical protein